MNSYHFKLSTEEKAVLASMTGLEVYKRAIERGNYHTHEWLAAYARAQTKEIEYENETERV